MVKMKWGLILAMLISGMVLSGGDARAGEPREDQVREVVDQWLYAWNRGDKDGVLALFAEDAGIAKGKETKLLTKAQYSKEISKRLARNKNIQAGSPAVSFDGEDSKAVVPMTFPSLGCRADVVFLMRLYDGKWMIRRFSTENLEKR